MKKVLSILVFAGIALATSHAAAQDALPTAGEAMGNTGGGDVVYKKETRYDFEADDVEGNLVKPDEANLNAEQHGKTSSLINIRSDFVNEMVESVEDI